MVDSPEYEERLKGALWTWYLAATALLVHSESPIENPRSAWVRLNVDYLHRYSEMTRTWWVTGLGQAIELQEWHDALAIFREAAYVQSQLGAMIWIGAVGRTLRPVDIANYLLVPPAHLDGPIDSEDDRRDFDNRISEVLSFMRSEQMLLETIIPLHGVTCQGELTLDNQLALIQLVPEQVCELLNSGALNPSALGPDSYFLSLGPAAALRQRMTMPKIVRPQGEGAPTQPGGDQGVGAVTRFLQCLLVATGARIRRGVSISRYPGAKWFMGGSMSFVEQPAFPDARKPVNVAESDWRSVTDVWAALSSTSLSGSVRLALNRLLQAAGRSDDSDRLLDVAIAAEAVFLRSVRIEMSYRFALHASYWLEGYQERSRSVLFGIFRMGSRLRNAVAHGADPKEVSDILKGRDLSEFAIEFEELVRGAIRKIIVDNKGVIPKDEEWTAMIVGGVEPPLGPGSTYTSKGEV